MTADTHCDGDAHSRRSHKTALHTFLLLTKNSIKREAKFIIGVAKQFRVNHDSDSFSKERIWK
jgi:hypothetical protein